jgi:Asp/Glu/hydantoin racemase
MHKLDILLINPNSAQKAYQNLAETYSAVEPPTWSLLLAKIINFE